MHKFWITKIRRKYIEIEWDENEERFWAEFDKKYIRKEHLPLLQVGTYLVYEKKTKLFRPFIRRWTKKELDKSKKEAEKIKSLLETGGLFGT